MGCEQAHLTQFCYPIRLVLHQHLNSHIAYILAFHLKIQTTHERNISTYHCTFSDYSDQSVTKLVHQKEDFQPVSH